MYKLLDTCQKNLSILSTKSHSKNKSESFPQFQTEIQLLPLSKLPLETLSISPGRLRALQTKTAKLH